ncbi:DUF6770 family protein [Flavivirga rizhaonensis]|uniref:WG repeat-containing protein n=1 Tax=Flavivirga rizhaonensis TaxID=2559571 RepID=A0A4S1E366_9FLAO|nr:DUF6770 family protein [Flavivirga rizhaonensis]TGV04392.1 hypothetical protein EM932_02395 [Flavivirga rizhaonensis]
MKKLCFVSLLFIALSVNAQISNLANLASGTMEIFTPIYEENKNIYGYFTLFKLDKLSQNEEKYEYVILDKNLNKVANGEFIDTTYKGIYSRYYSPDKVGDNLILTKHYGNMNGSIAFTSSRMLEMNSNDIHEPFYFKDQNLFKGSREVDNLKKEQRAIKFLNVPIGMNNGFLVIKAKKKMTKENPTNIYFYNLNHEKVWEYDFGDNKRESAYRLISFDDDALYFSYNTKYHKDTNAKFLQINLNTGRLNFSYLLEDVNSKYNYNYTVKKINDRTILTGKISPYKVSGYDYNTVVGFFKIVLDSKGNELFKKHFLWEEANEFIEMNKRGKLESGYKLFVQSYFIFKDERIVVLSEKFKVGSNLLVGGIVKTTDFVLLEFDNDFNLKSVETIKKDLSKFSSSDFLFAQYLNDEKDAVFFYQDYQKDSETKEKNWVLGIVSIVNGEINHEKIPMSSDDFYINPYIAREGYILLREFNKNSDFDKIRLERLNLN